MAVSVPYRRPSRAWLRAAAPRLVAAAVPASAGTCWRAHKIHFTSTFVAVAEVGGATGPHSFVVKVPYTAEGAGNLRRQVDVLVALHTEPKLLGWPPVAPWPVDHGEVDGYPYWVEERLPGTPVTRTVLRRDGLLDSAARLIDDFHARTSRRRLLDQRLAEAWVERPLNRIRAFYTTRGRPDRFVDAWYRLRGELLAALVGRTVRTCWIHGDFWPGNLLASDCAVTGVVDWDRAQPEQLRLHDLLHLHLFARWLTTRDELGEIVVRVIRHGIAGETGVPADRVATWLDGVPERAAVLLYWLRHVSLFINSEGHRDNRRWLRHNVERVFADV